MVVSLATSAVMLVYAAQVPSAAQQSAVPPTAQPSAPAEQNIPSVPAASSAAITVPYGTTVMVAITQPLSSRTSKVGDRFDVVVTEDVIHAGVVVIPKGTRGRGQVTFASKKGGFGSSGILGIALQHLEIGGRNVALDGRYREVGKSGDGAAAATMFAAGIFAGLVTGKSSTIPEGRVLKARLGEDMVIATVPAPVAAGVAAAPATQPPPP